MKFGYYVISNPFLVPNDGHAQHENTSPLP